MDSTNLNQLNASRHKRQRRRRRQGNGKVSDAGLSNGGSGRTTLSERLVQVKPRENAKVEQNVERLAEKPSKTEVEVQSKPPQKSSNSPPPPPPPSPSKPHSPSSLPHSSPEQNSPGKKSKKQRKKKAKENARSSSECNENVADDAGEEISKTSISNKQSRLSQSSNSSRTASLPPESKQSITKHPTVFDNVGDDAGERKSKTSISPKQSRASIKSNSSQKASLAPEAKLGEQKSQTSISNKQSGASLKSKSSQTGSLAPLEAKQSITMHQTVSDNVGDDAGQRKSKTSITKKQSRVSQFSNSSQTADEVGTQKSKTSITKKQSRLSQLSNSSHGASLAPEAKQSITTHLTVSDSSIPLSRLTQSETLLLYTNNFDIKSLIDKELIEATESVLIPLPSDLNKQDYDNVKEDCSTSPVLQSEEAAKPESQELVPLEDDGDLAASCSQTNNTDSTDAQEAEHTADDGQPEVSTHYPNAEISTDDHQAEIPADLHQKDESTDVDLTEDSTDVHETENSTDLSKMFYESRLQALLEDTREIANELLQKGAQGSSPQLALSEIPQQQHETIRSLKEIIQLLESVELKQSHEQEESSIASVPIEHEENHVEDDDVANEEQDDGNEEQELDVENLEDSYACVSNGMVYRVLQRKESPTCYSPLRNGKRLSRLEEFLLVKNNEMNTDKKETSSRSADSNQSPSSSSSTTTSRAPSAAASASGVSLTAINDDDDEQVEVQNDCKTSRTLLKTKKFASSWLRRLLRDCIGIFVTLMFLLFALFYCRDAKLQISSL